MGWLYRMYVLTHSFAREITRSYISEELEGASVDGGGSTCSVICGDFSNTILMWTLGLEPLKCRIPIYISSVRMTYKKNKVIKPMPEK